MGKKDDKKVTKTAMKAATAKTAGSRELSIDEVAEAYQLMARELKQLENSLKPLKKMLLDYARQNPEKFDEEFRLTFDSGCYVSLRTSDVLEATDDQRAMILRSTLDEYKDVKLNEKALIADSLTNAEVRKLLTLTGATIRTKETYAVYAD